MLLLDGTAALICKRVCPLRLLLTIATTSDDKLRKSMFSSVKSCCMTYEEQTIVEELIKILTPFRKATKILVC